MRKGNNCTRELGTKVICLIHSYSPIIWLPMLAYMHEHCRRTHLTVLVWINLRTNYSQHGGVSEIPDKSHSLAKPSIRACQSCSLLKVKSRFLGCADFVSPFHIFQCFSPCENLQISSVYKYLSDVKDNVSTARSSDILDVNEIERSQGAES